MKKPTPREPALNGQYQTVADVAADLKLTPRRVSQIAAAIGLRRVGRDWLFLAGDVELIKAATRAGQRGTK